jgi:hypothetical protein
MNTQKKHRSLAKALLKFIHQKDDLETLACLKNFQKQKLPKKATTIARPIVKTSLLKEEISYKAQNEKLPVEQKQAIAPKQEKAPVKFDLYQKLKDKVKKACPELTIREHVEIKTIEIPDCDVLLLAQKTIPDVYQGLMKAIDKQLGVTESILMDVSLINDLTQRHFKLILAPPFLTKWPSFMKQVRQSGKKNYFLGSSNLIFIEDAEILSSNIQLKSSLWNQIKTLFV